MASCTPVLGSLMSMPKIQALLGQKSQAALSSGRSDSRYTARMRTTLKIHGRIRLARRAAKLTQEQLAERFGISTQAVQQWETGRSAPERDRLPELAQALGVSLLWLAFGIGLQEQGGNDSVAAQLRPIGGRSVPVITARDAARDYAAAASAADQRSFVHFACSEDAFAVALWDRSNAPEFEGGDLVVIDPAARGAPGRMMFAVVSGQPVFGRLRMERAGAELRQIIQPLNNAWPETPIDAASDVLLGAMTEHIRPARP